MGAPDRDAAPDPVEHMPTVLGADIALAERVELPRGCYQLWLREPVKLSAETKERVYRALVPVTTRSFGADMTPYWARRKDEGYLEKLDMFDAICGPDGALVGWTSYHLLEFSSPVAYWDSTGMLPNWSRYGLMSKAIDSLFVDLVHLYGVEGDRRPFICARTENPVICRLVYALLGECYPNAAAPPPAAMADAIAGLAEWLGQGDIFQRDTFVVKGAYSSLDALYGERPKSGDPELDAFVYSLVGPHDAMLATAGSERLWERVRSAGLAPPSRASQDSASQDGAHASGEQRAAASAMA
jgi:hypothetical protein